MAEIGQRREWHGPEDVERLTIDRSRMLGEAGDYGSVYVGRIKFRGRPSKQVAVKIFHEALTAEQIGAYRAAIKRLQEARLPMPKMALVEHEGQHVLVSEAYKRAGTTKLSENLGVHPQTRLERIMHPFEQRQKVKARAQTMDLIAQLLNSGFAPHFDSIGFVALRKGAIKPVVFDIDSFALKEPAEHRRELIQHSVRMWLLDLFSKKERRNAVKELASKVSNPIARKALEGIDE